MDELRPIVYGVLVFLASAVVWITVSAMRVLRTFPPEVLKPVVDVSFASLWASLPAAIIAEITRWILKREKRHRGDTSVCGSD